jgi:squalene cyclase
MKRALPAVIVLFALTCAPVRAVDDQHWSQGKQAIAKGVAFLRKAQAEDGSWSAKVGPGPTALVLSALIDQPDIDAKDPAVRKAIEYLLKKQTLDGGIYDTILANYNTSICLSALARVKGEPGVAEAIKKGEAFLRTLQWTNQTDPQGHPVDKDHPFYGGVGYGGHGRPDGSNTQFFVQALVDVGCDCNDPAIQRAVAFFSELQGSSANKKYGDKIVQDGGAIYATSLDKDHIGVPESSASPELIDEGKAGRPVSGLRTYGAMTYAMFKTYVYAQLPRDDVRVQDAVKWIRNNYAVDHNPGMPKGQEYQGLYYYLVAMARALDAWHSDLTTADGKKINWDNDMIAQLVKMQREDGSWLNESDRWREGDPNLVTAYAIIALTHAMR